MEQKAARVVKDFLSEASVRSWFTRAEATDTALSIKRTGTDANIADFKSAF